MLQSPADDRSPVVSAKTRLSSGLRRCWAVKTIVEQRHRRTSSCCGCCRSRSAVLLERILIELAQRVPERQPCIEIVIDELDRKSIVGRRLQRAEKIHRLGVVPAIADEPVAAGITRKQRALEIADLLAVGHIIIEVAKTAAIDAIFGAVDRAARAGAEIQRAAGSVVAVERRRWPPDDIDGAIGARVDQVAAGKPVGLRDREAVVEDHEVAEAKTVA